MAKKPLPQRIAEALLATEAGDEPFEGGGTDEDLQGCQDSGKLVPNGLRPLFRLAHELSTEAMAHKDPQLCHERSMFDVDAVESLCDALTLRALYPDGVQSALNEVPIDLVVDEHWRVYLNFGPTLEEFFEGLSPKKRPH